MNKEIWLPIKDYESYYLVSNRGQVRSLRGANRILKPLPDKDGYLRVHLCVKRKLCTKYIHRLVAQSFIPNTNKFTVVNHLDCNILNNHVDNLEWCTPKMNTRHAIKMGRIPPSDFHWSSKLTREQTEEIKKLWPMRSVEYLANKHSVSQGTVKAILTGKTWKAPQHR